MQNLIHKFVLLGLLCPFLIAISHDSYAIRNISALSNGHPDNVSSQATFLNKTRGKEAAKFFFQKPATAFRKTIRRRLSKICAPAAQDLLSTTHKKYTAPEQHLGNPGVPGEYFSLLDALSTALKFLTQFQHTVP